MVFKGNKINMTQSLSNILQLLKNGENIFVEYKESKTELNKDVYQTLLLSL